MRWVEKLDNRFGQYFKSKLRALYNSRYLTLIKLNEGLANCKAVVVLVQRNELVRLSYFFEYYRAMGFKQFIVIDNRSDDGSFEFVQRQADVTLVSSAGVYKKSRYGIDWVNFIISKYCTGKWVLHVDADEFFVYPHHSHEDITALILALEKLGQKSLQCIMMDMYSQHPSEKNYYLAGQNPLDVCNLFDKNGYVYQYNSTTRTNWIKGGVRGRMFFDKISDSPALNKTPLVLWKKHYAFTKSAHELWPPHVNGGAPIANSKIYGALLHFKFLSDFNAKIREEANRKQHTDEYVSYGEAITNGENPIFVGDCTARYLDWRSLERYGLISGSALMNNDT